MIAHCVLWGSVRPDWYDFKLARQAYDLLGKDQAAVETPARQLEAVAVLPDECNDPIDEMITSGLL
jgi:hypothetical protein